MSKIRRVFNSIIDGSFKWPFRYFLYSLLFKNIKGFGYFGKPIFLSGISNVHIKGDFGIFPGARIECIHGVLKIGQGVRIGHNVLIDCTSKILIGNDTVFSANVYIGTTKYIIDDSYTGFKDFNYVGQDIIIGKCCFIGYGAVILPGTILGDFCVVGANSTVSGIYPSGSIISSPKSSIIRKRFE